MIRLDPGPVLDRFDSDRAAAAALGTTPTSIRRWRAGGGLTVDVADEIGTRLAGHPALLWPEWFDLPIRPRLLGPALDGIDSPAPQLQLDLAS